MHAKRHHHHHPGQLGGPLQRLRSLLWPQRKLFLLVFLWTCLCLVVFKTSLLSTSRASLAASYSQRQDDNDHQQASGLGAETLYPHHKRAVTSLSPTHQLGSQQQQSSPLDILAPEFDLPTSSPGVPPATPSKSANYLYQLIQDHSSGLGKSDLKTTQVSSSSGGGPNRGRPASTTTRTKSISQQENVMPPASSEKSTPESQVKSSSGSSQRGVKQKTAQLPKKSPVGGSECHYNYPNLFDLQFNNIHWQKLTSSGNGERKSASNSSTPLKPATFYLYNAYYDDRWRAGLPSVRVLAMIDRVHPPPTNCLLWASKSRGSPNAKPTALVTRAQFVYAWYPKWGNYEDGLLQPWIVTCPMPREHVGLVPESVSLVDVPAEWPAGRRDRRDLAGASSEGSLAEPMPASFSSSSAAATGGHASSSERPQSVQSPASHSTEASATSTTTASQQQQQATRPMYTTSYDCKSLQTITNNLPVFNRRPERPGKREKFAVCVKGLDFPYDQEHVSVRLVEWIEMLNLLGAKKIFLYSLDVHENISKVLRYYEERGLVELSPLTLPGDQPNLPEYQHLYLKQQLTSKRQNELIPYNDCLYRNLYSYQYLALLDIDEVIMPLKREHNNWHDLMGEVERVSLSEQNYSRASYNVRNVYFFDDLSGPLGTTPQSGGQPAAVSSASVYASASPVPAAASTQHNTGLYEEAAAEEAAAEEEGEEEEEEEEDGGVAAAAAPQRGRGHHRDSAERGIPHYLHMMSHVYRSKNYTEPGQYVKCFHNTERVISLHNHFPMNCFGQCTTYSIPVDLAHLQHYRKDCVGPLRQSCKNDFRLFTTRDTTIWKYKQRMIRRTTRVLNHLGLLAPQRQQVDTTSNR